ncbi:MAG: hypothetical protein ABI822_33815 [Bryobacteraceae bacterium]
MSFGELAKGLATDDPHVRYLAIMGFGGGAFLAGYLNLSLMKTLGVANCIIALGAMFFVLMMIGARIIRQPPHGWKPAGGTPSAHKDRMIADRSVTRDQAIRTVQFYLLWGILFINVTADSSQARNRPHPGPPPLVPKEILIQAGFRRLAGRTHRREVSPSVFQTDPRPPARARVSNRRHAA